MAKKPKRPQLSQDRQVRALKAERESYEHAISDCRGLRIRVYPSGKKSWYYRYRDRETGALRRMAIGQYKSGGMSLADARLEADRQRLITNEHGSALEYRNQQRRENRAALAEKEEVEQRKSFTVKRLIAEYVDDASRTLASWKEVDRALRSYVVPELGKKPAGDVTRKEVVAMLDKLSRQGKTVQRNRTLAYLRRAYNWAIQNDVHGSITANPCHMIPQLTETSKERYLGPTELKRFISNLPKTDIEPAMQDFYLLLLLTALRPGEVAGLSENDFDSEEKTLRLEFTKSGKPHVLPISAQADEIIARRIEESPGNWLFPMKRQPNRHIREDSVQKPLRDAIPSLKILPTTPHDLRRTAGTGIAALGAPRLIVSMILNHADQSVTSIYDRHHYLPELRQWLDKWGEHVESMTPKKGKRRAAS